jgi:hypothetical protein
VALFLCNGDEFLRFENLIHLENCWIKDKNLLCCVHGMHVCIKRNILVFVLELEMV